MSTAIPNVRNLVAIDANMGVSVAGALQTRSAGDVQAFIEQLRSLNAEIEDAENSYGEYNADYSGWNGAVDQDGIDDELFGVENAQADVAKMRERLAPLLAQHATLLATVQASVVAAEQLVESTQADVDALEELDPEAMAANLDWIDGSLKEAHDQLSKLTPAAEERAASRQPQQASEIRSASEVQRTFERLAYEIDQLNISYDKYNSDYASWNGAVRQEAIDTEIAEIDAALQACAPVGDRLEALYAECGRKIADAEGADADLLASLDFGSLGQSFDYVVSYLEDAHQALSSIEPAGEYVDDPNAWDARKQLGPSETRSDAGTLISLFLSFLSTAMTVGFSAGYSMNDLVSWIGRLMDAEGQLEEDIMSFEAQLEQKRGELDQLRATRQQAEDAKPDFEAANDNGDRSARPPITRPVVGSAASA